MSETIRFSAATVEDAITKATTELGITSDLLNYTVVEKGSKGFLGIGSKEAVIEVVTGEAPAEKKEEKKEAKAEEKPARKDEKKDAEKPKKQEAPRE